MGCGPPDMDQKDVRSHLFAPGGVLGGYHFGDAWDDIKKGHKSTYAVRDDDRQQLRRIGWDNGNNQYFLGFQLDHQRNVKQVRAYVQGSDQNVVVVRKVLNDAIAHFDKTVGGGRCNTGPREGAATTCDWKAAGKPHVDITYRSYMGERFIGTLHIAVCAETNRHGQCEQP